MFILIRKIKEDEIDEEILKKKSEEDLFGHGSKWHKSTEISMYRAFYE